VKARVPLLMQTLPYVLPSFMLRASLAPAYANPNAVTEALFRRYRDLADVGRKGRNDPLRKFGRLPSGVTTCDARGPTRNWSSPAGGSAGDRYARVLGPVARPSVERARWVNANCFSTIGP